MNGTNGPVGESAQRPISEAKRRRLDARVRKVLEGVLNEARELGCENPMIYIEPESGLHVLDKDHPNYDNNSGISGRQHAVVFSLGQALPQYTDAGGW